MERFYEKLAEVMDVDAVKESDVLAEFPEWDSLTALSVIAMIGAEYGVDLVAADLKNAGTARALCDLVNSKRQAVK